MENAESDDDFSLLIFYNVTIHETHPPLHAQIKITLFSYFKGVGRCFIKIDILKVTLRIN